MGCCNSCCGRQLPALVFLGPIDSGKSAIIAYIEHNAFQITHPTLGVETSTAVYQDQRVEIWDVSGRDLAIWPRYYNFASGIVFVVDGTNEMNINTFIEHAKMALTDQDVIHKPILMFINRVSEDDPNNILQSLSKHLEIDNKNLNIKLQACDPSKGQGISEGFNWLMTNIAKE